MQPEQTTDFLTSGQATLPPEPQSLQVQDGQLSFTSFSPISPGITSIFDQSAVATQEAV